MKVQLKLSDSRDAHIIKNLWPLYVHDISEFDATLPNRHGIIMEDESATTLVQQGETQNTWWKKPDSLFPYLILADDRPAGFNLIATHPSIPDAIEADFVVHEFFVLHPFRGNGVAEQAAIEGFDRHRGTWEVVTHPNHSRAVAFWHRVMRDYTGGECTERQGEHPWGVKTIFGFENVR